MQELKKAIYLYALPRMFISFIVVFLFVFLLGVHYNPFFAIAIIAAIASVSFTMLALYEKHVIEEYTSGTPFYARLKLPDGDIGELQNSIVNIKEIDIRQMKQEIEQEEEQGEEEGQEGKAKKTEWSILSKDLPEGKAYLVKFLEPSEIGEYQVDEAVLYSDNLNADLAPYSNIEFAVKGCFITLAAAVMTWKVLGIMPVGETKKGTKLGRVVAIVLDSKAKDKIGEETAKKGEKIALLANAVEIMHRLQEKVEILEKKLRSKEEALERAKYALIEKIGDERDLIDLDIVANIARSTRVRKIVTYVAIGVAAVIGGVVIGTLFGHIFVNLMGW